MPLGNNGFYSPAQCGLSFDRITMKYLRGSVRHRLSRFENDTEQVQHSPLHKGTYKPVPAYKGEAFRARASDRLLSYWMLSSSCKLLQKWRTLLQTRCHLQHGRVRGYPAVSRQQQKSPSNWRMIRINLFLGTIRSRIIRSCGHIYFNISTFYPRTFTCWTGTRQIWTKNADATKQPSLAMVALNSSWVVLAQMGTSPLMSQARLWLPAHV